MSFKDALGRSGPFLFGVGFVAPLIAQSMDVADVEAPLGVSNLVLGLLLGAMMGTVAMVRGRWI